MSDAFTASDDVNPADDFFEIEDLNNDALLRLLSNAYMDASIVDDDLKVNEGRTCWVSPEVERKRIWLSRYTVFKSKEGEIDKLRYINRINDEMPIVRASISSKTGNLALDWYISVDGGVTRRSIIYGIKHFLEWVDKAIQMDTDNLLA